jgi:hypothetical protein
MFERFTDRAKKVMSLARQAAIEWQHASIAPEHLLAGLVDEGSGVAANVLLHRGTDLAAIRRLLAERLPRGERPDPNGQLQFTADGKRVLELALEESGALCHNYIGTEHLLLGLLRLDHCVAHAVLRELGCELAAIRDEVVEFLCGPESDDDEPGLPQHLIVLPQHMLAKIVPGLAIAITPAGDAFDRLRDEGIQPALRAAGYSDVQCLDVGHAPMAYAPMLRHQIERAELLVVVVPSPHDPNLAQTSVDAHYLLGLCHGASRLPILLTDRSQQLPANNPWLPVLDYDLAADHQKLRERLTAWARQRHLTAGDGNGEGDSHERTSRR